eukprot:2067433-Lingulodinium_polyedra.AAC.1
MVRLNRRFAAAVFRKSRACAFHARAGFRSARGARGRAVCKPVRRLRAWQSVAWRGVAWRGVAWRRA